MRFVVTGAAGFVGYSLSELLVKRFGVDSVQAVVGPAPLHEKERARQERLQELGVRTIASDLRECPVLRAALTDFDVLFHLAAYARTEEDSRDVRINDLGTERLIRELGPRLEGARVVYASSIAAVDAPPGGGRIDMTAPCAPKTEYGATKLAGEEIVKRCAAGLGYRYSILRLSTVYGPGFRPGGMFDVLAHSLRANGLSARICWPGKISLVGVSDLAEILLAAATDGRMADRTFLVSTNEDPSMGAISEQIARAIGADYRPIRLPHWLMTCLRSSAWPIWQTRFIPHPLRISAWRLSLVIEGLYADGSELTSLLNFRYRPWKEEFPAMYADTAEYGRDSAPANASHEYVRHAYPSAVKISR
ncbi:MAG: NAD-dependent epimerase/dehydratase family protein [Bryobacteraceae bacterium]